jgi:hypothetical protein
MLWILGITAIVAIGVGAFVLGSFPKTGSTTPALVVATVTLAPSTPDAQATIGAAVAATLTLQARSDTPPRPTEPMVVAKPTDTAPPPILTVAPTPPPILEPTPQPTATNPPPLRWATVMRRYGAALRTAPSSDAPIMAVVGCGEALVIVRETTGGWLEVGNSAGSSAGSRMGYVGAGRVAVGTQRATPDCRGAVTFSPNSVAVAVNATNCVGVRSSRSVDAPPLGCYPNGSRFQVLNGPISDSGDEDWFYVRANQSVAGWARADYLARP